MDSTERDIHRENTLAFIAENPVNLVLTPVDERVRIEGGFRDVPGTARPSQTFRIIELGMTSQVPTVRTQDGRDRKVEFWLLGAHDAAVAVGDTWKDGNRLWEIGEIMDQGQAPLYETRCVVVEHGK